MRFMLLEHIHKYRSASKYVVAAILTAGFVLSRLFYSALGVRFDASPLTWFWQYLDPLLLKTHPVQSIVYLHSQPPLMNTFLALVLHLFPGYESTAFHVTFLGLGLAFCLGLYLALTRVALPRSLAAIVALIYVASPPCVLYENWLFYTYPVAVCLVWAAVFLHRFLTRPSTKEAAGLFTMLAALALTWSMFHFFWLLLGLALLILLRRKYWKQLVIGAALPLFLVFAWYAKNLFLFRQFAATSWSGMNFSKITNAMLTEAERKQLYDQGIISALSLVPPFSDLATYSQYLSLPESTGVPALDQRVKQSGIVNFNHLAYIQISRQLLQDNFRILKYRPQAYVRGLAESYLNFLLPSSAYLFLAENRRRIQTLTRLWDTVVCGRFQYNLAPELRRYHLTAYYRRAFANIGFWILAAYLAAFVLGLLQLRHARRQSPQTPFFLFLWFVVFSLVLLGNQSEVGENNRFRFALDPLVLIMLTPLLWRIIQQRIARVAHPATHPKSKSHHKAKDPAAPSHFRR